MKFGKFQNNNMSGSKYYNSTNIEGGLFARRRKTKNVEPEKSANEER